MSDSLSSSTTWTAPDGSNWYFEVTGWVEVNGREEAKGVRLASIDKPKRPVTAVLHRSVPLASLIGEVRTARVQTRALLGASPAGSG